MISSTLCPGRSFLVRLRDEHLEGLRLGRSEERRRSGHRQDRADLDRLRRLRNRPRQKDRHQNRQNIPFLSFISLSFGRWDLQIAIRSTMTNPKYAKKYHNAF